MKNLEQYEEAARRALETKEDFEKQLNERRQTLENEEDKVSDCGARLVHRFDSVAVIGGAGEATSSGGRGKAQGGGGR